MELVENKVATRETITVDGKHFVNCRFTNCTVIYEGGEFTATTTVFENCPIVLGGAAQRTAGFLGWFEILKQPTGAPPVAEPPKTIVQ